MARRQLLALGMSGRAIDRRVQGGRLHVIHHGVYAVGHRGLAPHHSRPFADEVTTVEGIPVTSVSRTLLDLASSLDRRRLRRAVDEAERLRLWGSLSLDRLIARHRGRRALRITWRQLHGDRAALRRDLTTRLTP